MAIQRRVLPNRVHLDYETYSDVDITEVGAWAYAEHSSTRMLIATFKYHGETLVWCYDPRFKGHPKATIVHTGRDFPPQIDALIKQGYRIIANNAEFEYVITNLVCNYRVRPEQFECMAACQSYFHLSRHLDKAARSLGFAGKADKGKALIMRFSTPGGIEAEEARLTKIVKLEAKLAAIVKPKTSRLILGNKKVKQIPGQESLFGGPAVKDEDETVSLRAELAALRADELTFDMFVDYNIQDVEQTALIDARLAPYWSELEVQTWQFTLRMNERGVLLDHEYMAAMRRIMVGAPTTVTIQGKAYPYADFASAEKTKGILQQLGWPVLKLDKHDIENMLASLKTPEFIKRALEARRDASRVSLGKLDVFTRYASYDGRLRGSYITNGTDTLRWASWGVQLQNLPKPDKGIKSAECADAIMTRDVARVIAAGKGYHNRALVAGLSGLITAGPGRVFTKSDFAQVEARFVLWLADDYEHLKLWADGRDMYCEMAQKVFGREIKKGRDDKERDVGKRLVLACNFALGGTKFEEVEAPKYGLDMKGLKITGDGCVQAFRDEFTSLSDWTTGLWSRLENAMIDCIESGESVSIPHLTFHMFGTACWVELPAGGYYIFRDVEVREECRVSKRTGRSYVAKKIYHTVCSRHGENREDLYGGKLADLFTQRSCRDLQRDKMLEAESAGLLVELQTHDEITINSEASRAAEEAAMLKKIMTTAPAWCQGFPIGVDMKTEPRYLK